MHSRRGAGLAAACAVVLVVLCGSHGRASGSPVVDALSPLVPLYTLALAVDNPFEERLGGFTKNLVRDLRRNFRMSSRMLSRSVAWWRRWFKRASFFIGIAVVAGLADRGLVAAWRREGLHVLANYLPLMLYVYGRLLFGRGVNPLAKLFLVAAILYGVTHQDLIPDRSLFPGLVDDIAIIVVAARVFVYKCPEALVNEYAERALHWRNRFRRLRRAEP